MLPQSGQSGRRPTVRRRLYLKKEGPSTPDRTALEVLVMAAHRQGAPWVSERKDSLQAEERDAQTDLLLREVD